VRQREWKLPLRCGFDADHVRDAVLQHRRHVAAVVFGWGAFVVSAERVDVRVNLTDERFHLRIDERQESLAADGDEARHEL
jgi:phosphosulfolactate synthase (CoM biosynthesis protein A)